MYDVTGMCGEGALSAHSIIIEAVGSRVLEPPAGVSVVCDRILET